MAQEGITQLYTNGGIISKTEIPVRIPRSEYRKLSLFERREYNNEFAGLMIRYNLDKHEVRSIMQDNTEALMLYNKGLKQDNTLFWIFCLANCPLVVGNLFILLDENYAVGLPLVGGGALIMLGSYLTIGKSSVKNIKKSVDVYNDGIINKTSMELNFGITSNGLGIVLRF